MQKEVVRYEPVQHFLVLKLGTGDLNKGRMS